MKELTNKEKVKQLKEKVIAAGYETYRNITDNRYVSNKHVGTMYIVEKMDYGFHIYFIHEPDSDNPLAGVEGVITEMYYDLRNRVYWIKRNMKEVKFSVRNVDAIFPKDRGDVQDVFDKLSTPNNQGLYRDAYKFLGAQGLEEKEMFGRFFYRLITDYSYFEILHKAGIAVNSGLRIAKRTGKSPREILGLSKTQWKIVSKYGVSPNDFTNLDNPQKDRELLNYLAYISDLEEEFGVEKIKDFMERERYFLYHEEPPRWSSSALHTAERYNLPVKILIRFLYFQCDVSQGLSSFSALDTYEDYVRMTTEMGYERFDRYPKFLRTAHDVAARNYKVKLNEAELVEWQEAVSEAKEFESSQGGYQVVVPDKPEDLIREGNVLGHCVSSYVNKVRKKSTTIVFLRDKLDLDHPLVTIEIRGDRIVQAKGKMNNPPKVSEKEAIHKFAKKYELTVANY